MEVASARGRGLLAYSDEVRSELNVLVRVKQNDRIRKLTGRGAGNYFFLSLSVRLSSGRTLARVDREIQLVSGVLLAAALLLPRLLAFFRVIAPGGLIGLAGDMSSRRTLRPRQPREYAQLLALRLRRILASEAGAGAQCASLARLHLDGRLHRAHQQGSTAALIERGCPRVKFMS